VKLKTIPGALWEGVLGKNKKIGLEMVASAILAMLLFVRVENHYADWGWREKVEKVRCQLENTWHRHVPVKIRTTSGGAMNRGLRSEKTR
jgi:hypothetical protein